MSNENKGWKRRGASPTLNGRWQLKGRRGGQPHMQVVCKVSEPGGPSCGKCCLIGIIGQRVNKIWCDMTRTYVNTKYTYDTDYSTVNIATATYGMAQNLMQTSSTLVPPDKRRLNGTREGPVGNTATGVVRVVDAEPSAVAGRTNDPQTEILVGIADTVRDDSNITQQCATNSPSGNDRLHAGSNHDAGASSDRISTFAIKDVPREDTWRDEARPAPPRDIGRFVVTPVSNLALHPDETNTNPVHGAKGDESVALRGISPRADTECAHAYITRDANTAGTGPNRVAAGVRQPP